MVYGKNPTFILMCSIFMTSWICVLSCRDCDNAKSLKCDISSFYDFQIYDGNYIAKPKWSVFTEWDSDRSSCPWESYVQENATWFPSRLYTARLTLGNPEPGKLFTMTPQRCLRYPGSNRRRLSTHICEPLFRNVPVAVRTGCYSGCNYYKRENVTIAVGFACVFNQ